jgi:predicted transposase
MRQTIVLRLEPNPAQHKALLATMEAFNHACQRVADVAYEKRTANKIALQPLVYADLRKDFNLSSQMVVRCISKACEAYKSDKRVHVHFDLHDPMIFDQRILSIRSLTTASILCLTGRQMIPFRFESYLAGRTDRTKGQADLVLQNEVFYLHVYVEIPSTPASTQPGAQSATQPLVIPPMTRRGRPSSQQISIGTLAVVRALAPAADPTGLS